MMLLIAGSIFYNQSQNNDTVQFKTDEKEDAMVGYLKDVLARTTDYWTYTLSDSNIQYKEPHIVFFKGETKCKGFPHKSSCTGVFYCNTDSTIYFDMAFLEYLCRDKVVQERNAATYLLAHSVSHHVQNILGITNQVSCLKEDAFEERKEQINARYELQADCITGLFFYNNSIMQDVDEKTELYNYKAISRTYREWNEMKPKECETIDDHQWSFPGQTQHWIHEAYKQPKLSTTNTYKNINVKVDF